jgi:hypothetical protein
MAAVNLIAYIMRNNTLDGYAAEKDKCYVDVSNEQKKYYKNDVAATGVFDEENFNKLSTV